MHFFLAHCAPTEQSIPHGQCLRAPPTVSLSGWCLVKSHALLLFPHCETSDTRINTREPCEYKTLRHKLTACCSKSDTSDIFYNKLVDYRSYAIFPDHHNSLKMNPHCARCGKIVYATEKVNCLDKVYRLYSIISDAFKGKCIHSCL